jgi:two-component system, OmpR family, alkaline phosphatase synthesis response regulator PhoP
MPIKLLLTDDEIFIMKAAEFKLKKAGFEVHCANDGEEAWSMLETVQPHMLITDYQMPRLNGMELIARIRASGMYDALPIILLTAKGLEIDHAALIAQYRLSTILSKPFSPKELVELAQRETQLIPQSM